MTQTSCHEDEDDIFTDAVVTLSAPDGMEIEQIQGTVTLTDINHKQTFVANEFVGNTTRTKILRGAYSIIAEGYVAYKENGISTVGQFRAYTDYAELEKNGSNSVELEFYLMN